MQPDPFDEILGLEEQFYDEGYQQGLTDGVKAGRIEGRTFGLEKGFEKYVESGRLHGKSLIWANRLPQLPKTDHADAQKDETDNAQTSEGDKLTPSNELMALPPLSDNVRLAKHIKVIYALAESESLSTENSEEAVSDFDDRLKRAQAKAKIIERMTGEGDAEGSSKVVSSNDGSIEDVSVLSARH